MTKIPATRPWVIAHRGASGYRPEHTRAAYELALTMGADAVEPDLVPTSDGVLVVRHESEISGTTDVAAHPEFAERRQTKVIDGETLTGWFTEDFTWAELATLRAIERIPETRPNNASFDGDEPILRFSDLLDLLEAHNSAAGATTVGLVAEIKHSTYFWQLGFDLSRMLAEALRGRPWGHTAPLVVESFELTPLVQLQRLGVPAEYVFLIDSVGKPADRVAADGHAAPTYRSYLEPDGLASLARHVDGISLSRKLVAPNRRGMPGANRALVARASSAGLKVYVWTLRAESQFLSRKLRMHETAFGRWRPFFVNVFALGVDGVFADQPDLAIEARSTLVD